MSIAAVFLIVTLILTILYFVSARKFGYWNKKGVPHLKPLPILGNYGEYITLRKDIGKLSQEVCRKFANEPYFGTYFGTEPALTVLDPEIIKLILTKDFYYFNSRTNLGHDFKEFITTHNIFFVAGNRWKALRQIMTPMFSSLKLKNMFASIQKCAYGMESAIDRDRAVSEVFDARSMMIRYGIDCIISSSFGVESNTLAADYKTNYFYIMGNTVFSKSTYSAMKWVAWSIWPGIFYRLGLKYYSDDVPKFFAKLLRAVFEERQYKPSSRNDIADMLLSLNQKDYIEGDALCPRKEDCKKVQMKIDYDVIVGICIALFSGGFETSANTLGYCFYEFARNPETQRKAQKEIDEFLQRHNNRLDYECVSELPYLEACFNETMRLYPVLSLLTREVVDGYTFPDGLRVEKGVRIHIPVNYLHYNPDYFPEPEKFRPDRFLPGAKSEVNPYIFLPFGEGPRICTGLRFAKMQVMTGLITILKKYNVEVTEGTPSQVEFVPGTVLSYPSCNMILKLTVRDGWEDRVYAV